MVDIVGSEIWLCVLDGDEGGGRKKNEDTQIWFGWGRKLIILIYVRISNSCKHFFKLRKSTSFKTDTQPQHFISKIGGGTKSCLFP